MPIKLDNVEALSPDQASLKAASRLLKSTKWPVCGHNAATGLIWGECQGSGSNPYRVMADSNDYGYKCTCPSRKFPCKHSLALMWMFAEQSNDFSPGDVPDWVSDWVDEMPARILALPAEARPDALINEFGKLVLLAKAWRIDPSDPDLKRTVTTAETRDAVLEDSKALRVDSTWEVLDERVATRRDGQRGQSWTYPLPKPTPPPTRSAWPLHQVRYRDGSYQCQD